MNQMKDLQNPLFHRKLARNSIPKSSLTSYVRPINLREDMKIAITVNTHNSAFGSTLANQS